jgi:hypothetical protein
VFYDHSGNKIINHLTLAIAAFRDELERLDT